MTNAKTKWYASLLTPQTIFLFLGAMSSIMFFWFKSQESWAEIKQVKEQLKEALIKIEEQKADKADLKANEDRVTRQYEQLGKQSERITALEKNTEYQRGRQDAIKEGNNNNH